MGEDPVEHGRPSIVLFLKRQWARFLPMLRNKWTLRIIFGLFKLLLWVARRFDWL
jgi:hypothetical protein